jgi:hypothetical protein
LQSGGFDSCPAGPIALGLTVGLLFTREAGAAGRGQQAATDPLKPQTPVGTTSSTGTMVIATSASALLVVEKSQMTRLLHEQHALSDRFLA